MRSKGRAGKSKCLKYPRQVKEKAEALLRLARVIPQMTSPTTRQLQYSKGRQKIEAFIQRSIKLNKRPILRKPLVAHIKHALGIR